MNKKILSSNLEFTSSGCSTLEQFFSLS